MLTRDDIDLLMKGLDAIERSQQAEDAMSLLFAGALAPKGQEREVVEKVSAEREAGWPSRRLMQERVVLLKAKLIQMRDATDVREFYDELRRDVE